ncbi:transmembrane protein 218 [Aplysia californica]|uniref:Transmembrane protein 218 n=1 Tax=Aplysia californica TaxID=6500 RepID=A0ABM0JAQ8_APLCA|nr:transmembrane protein 218 [Aplysia californica]
MASTVLNVGIGLFILAFLWVLALSVCVAFARSPTKIANIGPLAVVAALVISVILIFIPREDQFPSAEEQSVVYDYSIVYRSSLIAVMALFVLLGGVFYLVFHAMTPVHAKPLRKFLR